MKIYQKFQDKYGNEYQFQNYLDFAEFWFSLTYRRAVHMFPDNFKKLQYAAAYSREARKKITN